MKYTPRPIDTDGIELPATLDALVERLAEHVHDTWAQGRIAQGWKYGKQRNDARREHPDLLPYDQLPESEKEFDRNSVCSVIRAIVALGYTIKKEEL